MFSEPGCPAHVPTERVRPFEWDYDGSLSGLFPRLDTMQVDAPVVWLQPSAGGGAWLLTQADEIRRAFRDTSQFSSRFGGDGVPMMIPLMMDPPEHTAYRRQLHPLFTKSAVAKLEGPVRARFRRLLDEVADKGGCDFVDEVAIKYPTGVFIEWIGVAEDETAEYVGIISSLIHGTVDDRTAAILDLYTHLDPLIEERMTDPGDDLLSDITRIELDGQVLTKDELIRTAFLLFIAGLDTVVAALSFSMAHLARTPDDPRALAERTVPVDRAVDELLRRHSFVTVPRVVAEDVVIDGVTLREGDPLFLATSLASRDQTGLSCPFDVDFTRESANNYAFGLGSHHCLGAHLARLEMRIALDEWHARIPEYELDGDPQAYGSFVMGLAHLPLRW